MEQIQNFQTGDLITEIWELAQGYKKTASDTRLGLPRVQNANLQKTHSGTVQAQKKVQALERATPGISKGMTRIQEAKDKHEQGKKIKMIISLTTIEGTKKAVPVSFSVDLAMVFNLHDR